MVILDGLKEIEYGVFTRVAIGKFDGIHAGHQKLIKEITSQNDGLKSVVFTFKFSSAFLKGSDRIYSEEERRNMFSDLGVDYLVEYDLNDITSKMEPEEFARTVLKERMHCREVVCGDDLSFGYKGRGDVLLLKSMEKELGITTRVIDKLQYNGEDISSTRIRKAIELGNMTDVENMLRGFAK